MNNNDRVDPLALVAKIAEQERRLTEGTFLAPVVNGGKVRVRVSGIVYELKVDTPFEGWAILKMKAQGEASVIEEAPPTLVTKYLQLFPRIRMVMINKFKNHWWALPASTSDTRLKLSGPVPINLVRGGTKFDTVHCRFAGGAFWFENVDRRRDPAIARALNKSLSDKVEPAELRCLNATPQEKLAYRMVWLSEFGEGSDRLSDMSRITAALKHAGAELQNLSYSPEGNAVVQMLVDGHVQLAHVRVDDLSVVSSGICLSGMDSDFDLASLVSVFREAGPDAY